MIEVTQQVYDPVTLEVVEQVTNINIEVGDYIVQSATYTDTELPVTVDGQTIFNIFAEPSKSNLFISDNIYFKDKSYNIQFISGAWKLVWLNEFPLETTDTLIFRTI